MKDDTESAAESARSGGDGEATAIPPICFMKTQHASGHWLGSVMPVVGKSCLLYNPMRQERPGMVLADEALQPLLRDDEAHGSPAEPGSRDPDLSGSAEKLEIESAIDQASVIRRVNWHLLPAFFCLAMLCSIDRANLSFAALQLNHDLHFSDAVYGYGSGVFFIGYALFALPSTYLCAWMGTPLFLGGALVIWGSVATLFSAMRSSWQFFLLRFILGLAESGAYPGMWYHLALFYDEREMGLAYTLVSTASSLSGALGSLLASGLLRMDGLLDLHGWQWLFLVEGIPAIVLGIVLYAYLAPGPAAAKFLSAEEREWLCSRKEKARLAKAHSSVEALREKHGEMGSFQRMLREWRIWYLALIWAIICVGMDTLNFWLPLLIKSIMYGEAPSEPSHANRDELQEQSVNVALLSGIPFTSAAIGMVIVALLAKRTGERRWHIAVPLFVGTASMITTPLVEKGSQVLAVAGLTIGAVGIWGPHGPLLSWPAALLDGNAAASGFALIKMVGAFAAFGGNAAMGELHEETHSFALPMFLLAGLLALGALLALAFKEPGKPRAFGIRDLVGRLQDRMAVKRSRSDPASFYPRRTFSGSMSTIREHLARPDRGNGELRFEMPALPPRFELATSQNDRMRSQPTGWGHDGKAPAFHGV